MQIVELGIKMRPRVLSRLKFIAGLQKCSVRRRGYESAEIYLKLGDRVVEVSLIRRGPFITHYS